MATCTQLLQERSRLQTLLQHVFDDSAKQEISDQLANVNEQIKAQGCEPTPPPPTPKRAPFHPTIEGFAFHNHWTFDQSEKDTIHRLFQASVGPAIAALGPLLTPAVGLVDAFGALLGIPPGTLELAGLVASVTGALNGLVDAMLPEHYGLCGGMAFAALDYYKAGLIIQRGFPDVNIDTAPGRPERNTPQGTILRNYIWQRLIDSLTSGVAQTTLEWMAILHFVPQQASGGAPELLKRTKDQWAQLKQHIDAGTPWPLGLIGTTTNPMHNHQVLAYGYLDNEDGTGVIYLYDNVCPDTESTIQLDFRGQSLSAQESCGSDSRGPLQGFFCSSYQPNTSPPVAVGITQSPVATPAGLYTAGQQVAVSYIATNIGFGDSPPLKLYVIGSSPAGQSVPPIVPFTSPAEEAMATPIASPVSSVAPHDIAPGNNPTRQLVPPAQFSVPQAGDWSFTALAWLGTFDGRDTYKTLPVVSQKTKTEGKESKEGKEASKDSAKEKEGAKDRKDSAKEIEHGPGLRGAGVGSSAAMLSSWGKGNAVAAEPQATGQAFIRAEERPDVGGRITQQPPRQKDGRA